MKLIYLFNLWKYMIATYIVVKIFQQLDLLTNAIIKNTETINMLFELFSKSRFFR